MRAVPLALTLLLLAPAAGAQPRPARTAAAGRPAAPPRPLEPRVDSLVRASIADRAFPAAAVAIGRTAAPVLLKGYGRFTYVSPKAVTVDTPFDLASLTKVVATTTVAMRFYERGLLDLDAPLGRYLPALDSVPSKRAITVRQVMTHSAGLRPFIPFYARGIATRAGVLRGILDDSLVYRPGAETRYSDFGFILLGLALERIGGAGLDVLAEREVFGPLGMAATRFRPVGALPDAEAVVPTEFDPGFRRRLVQGEVHDETAWTMGGVSGHAGLFSTARDLGRFAAMLVAAGRLPDGGAYLRPETVRLFTTRAGTPAGSTRALGWDTKADAGYSSGGTKMGRRAFGHTGFTGTSLWVDPDAGFYVVLLTNRVYPTRDNPKLSPVRSKIADLAFDALGRR